jgi:two-component system, LytTR family, sensor kinase
VLGGLRTGEETLFLGAWAAFGVILTSGYVATALLAGAPWDGVRLALVVGVTDTVSWAVVAIAGIWAARQGAQMRLPWWTAMALVFLFAVLLVAARLWLLVQLGRVLGWEYPLPFLRQLLEMLPEHLIIFLAFVGGGYGMRQARAEAELELELHRLRLEIADAEFRGLSAQVPAGLLLDRLAAIEALLAPDPERARRHIAQVGDLLRYSFRTFDSAAVAVEAELAVVNAYVALENEARVVPVELRVDAQGVPGSLPVPPMSLFALATLALRCLGSEPAGAPALRLTLAVEGGRLVIRMRSECPAGGAGGEEQRDTVGRLRARLERLFGADYQLRVESGRAKGFDVEMRLPVQQSAGDAGAGASDRGAHRRGSVAEAGESSSRRRLSDVPFEYMVLAGLVAYVGTSVARLGVATGPTAGGVGMIAVQSAGFLAVLVVAVLLARVLQRPRWRPRLLPVLVLATVSTAITIRLLMQIGACQVAEVPCFGPLPALMRTSAFLGLMFVAFFTTADAVLQSGRKRQRALDAALLAARASEARVRALRMQLNPHFLFNALNSLSGLAAADPARARVMVVRLRELLDVALHRAHALEVPLAEELRVLDLYLEVERGRYGDRLRVERRVQPGLDGVLVPHLLLQPIVENAVRHGLASRDGPGIIRIAASASGNRLQLRVSDNGPGMREGWDTASGGVGLANTAARLQELYGPAQRMELHDAEAGGLVVLVELPLRQPTVATDVAGPANVRDGQSIRREGSASLTGTGPPAASPDAAPSNPRDSASTRG